MPQTARGRRHWPWHALTRMAPRDPSQPHRVSTPLELLFDLTFVIAVATVSEALARAIEADDLERGLVGYPLMFFAIWWAWMNFTWFASAYDRDDAIYRILTLLQMAGVLVLAAGVPAAVDRYHFTTAVVGYIVMRVAMVCQWLRAAASDPDRRRTCLRYAAGIFVVQVGWTIRLAIPDDSGVVVMVVLLIAEVLVPLVAEREAMTPWHPHHIAERYGLFTIIVLGESVTAASTAMAAAFDAAGVSSGLAELSVGGLVLLFGMWWIYFLHETGEALDRHRNLSYVWGYAHYVLDGSIAAVGATLGVAAATGLHEDAPGRVSGRLVAMSIGGCVAAFLIVTAYVHGRLTEGHPFRLELAATTAVALLSVGWLVGPASVPLSTLLQGLAVVAVVVLVSRPSRARTW